ncbi:hypothetical protein Barb7_02548 [Bacteroidales bacterium Barb7]|nr:hypothetical protein Barb7_02548 [Bacteroidales bacterium Barb7]
MHRIDPPVYPVGGSDRVNNRTVKVLRHIGGRLYDSPCGYLYQRGDGRYVSPLAHRHRYIPLIKGGFRQRHRRRQGESQYIRLRIERFVLNARKAQKRHPEHSRRFQSQVCHQISFIFKML